MSELYEEIFQGEAIMRRAPGARHEAICARLHSSVASSLLDHAATQLLAPRSPVQLTPGTLVCPDLALVTVATNKPWLLAEIVDAGDHRMDTVTKKAIYEDLRIPRLWMIDPRYDNVEIYHATEYGLALRGILAHREFVEEAALPLLHINIASLFGLEIRH
jgi:Uma2 family endonuclease